MREMPYNPSLQPLLSAPWFYRKVHRRQPDNLHLQRPRNEGCEFPLKEDHLQTVKLLPHHHNPL